MKRESAGSAVLLILMFMGILTVFLLTTLQQATFLRMLVGKQIIAERYISFGHGLLSYGIVHAKKNYEQLMLQQEVELEFVLDDYIGKVMLIANKEGVLVSSELLDESAAVFYATCQVSKNLDKKFIIQGFQR